MGLNNQNTEENREIIGAVLTIIGGTFAILASIFNWSFFFEHRKAKFFVEALGRQGSRVFYAIFGVVLYVLAYLIISGEF